MNLFKNEHVLALQAKMKEDNTKAYLILTSDPHFDEIIAPYFLAERAYFCPFTGSAGELLITQDNAYLFTDGRYWIQAAKQLENSVVTLIRKGDSNVLPLEDFIINLGIKELTMDLNFVSLSQEKKFSDHGITLIDKSYRSLVEGAPKLSEDKLFVIEDKLNTLTRDEKIAKVTCEVLKAGAKATLISSLDDIAWTLNLRGNDMPRTPLFYSYLYLSKVNGNHLFINKSRVPGELKGITLHDYDEVFDFLKSHNDTKTLLDPNKTSLKIKNCLPLENIVFKANPGYLMKAIKGPVEISNIKRIQALDGVVLLKFGKFIQENIKNNLSEYDYRQKVDSLRFENKELFDLSFDTIAACGANAALMHYQPTKENHSTVNSEAMELLVDSGGHYFGGTTDTTRTFLLGKPTEEYIHDYTLTLKSVINLSRTIFLRQSTGQTIDIRAREIMWREGLDYKCGTGHGVGYMLNVHEGPNGFRYHSSPDRDDQAAIVPGMVTTIEPGVYKENKFGIRIENNLLCIPAFINEFGEFYKFETITYAPIDTGAIDLSLLKDDEINWLNEYHKHVYDVLYPLIKDDVELVKYLKDKTVPLKR